jgi:hypothetical protein
MTFWLDQGKLFLAKESVVFHRRSGTEVVESRRFYEGGRLVLVESRNASFAADQLADVSALPFAASEAQPAGAAAETEGFTLEEIALETASQLAPVTLTNRPVRWE